MEGLGLEKAGVECDSKGIKVNAELRTTAPHIWACGDVLGGYLFTHVAEGKTTLAALETATGASRRGLSMRRARCGGLAVISGACALPPDSRDR